MKTYLLQPNTRTAIGRSGDTGITVQFDALAWYTDYPAGLPYLMVTWPGGRQTPVTVTYADGLISGEVPDELLVRPGLYSYVFAWVSAGEQVMSSPCGAVLMDGVSKRWEPHSAAPDWADRIFLAAESIEQRVNGAIEAEAGAQDAKEGAEAAQDAAEDAVEDAEAAQAAAEAAQALAQGYANAAAESASQAMSGTPEGYADLVSSVGDLKSVFDSVTATGENKFNKNTASIGRRIRPNGTEAQVSGAYHSELIPVVPGSTLYIARGLGSSSNITCCFFDENKDYVDGSNVIRTNTDAFSTTVPADCYYMILNGATTYIDSMYVYTKNMSDYIPYYILPNGRTGNVIGLYSGSRIYYKDGVLFSASQLRLRTFETTYTLGTSVTVGTGIWLFWNSLTHELFAGNDYSVISDSVYFVCGIGSLHTYNADDGFMGFLGYTPVIEVDLANNKLRYKSTDNAYLYVHSERYTISAQTAEFAMTQYTVLYYDREDTQLHVTNTYNENTTSRVVLLERLGSSIVSITPYVSIINENANAGKKCVCYGDSLTYYDKKNFTWGPQQGTKCVGYESYLESYNGMDVANRGQSGKTTPQICENLKSASDLATFDYLILMGGNNDDRLEVGLGTVQPVGGTFDTTTVAGALQSAIEYALTQNPALRIILMTEPMGWTYEDNTLKRVSELIPNTYRNVAKQYGLPLIDLWEKSGVNELTRNNYYLDPPDTENTLYMYHPNNTGWRQISKIICNEIKQY